jgi:hypothetical protein
MESRIDEPALQCNLLYTSVISGKDGHTKICSDCGLNDGLETSGMKKAPYQGPQYWTVDHRTGNETARTASKSD